MVAKDFIKINDNFYEKNKKKVKSENGITLIALIVTIIVLLILAGITIGAITGEDNIIDNTKFAKFSAKIRQYQDRLDEYLIGEEQKRK